jgi:hypothetical protein
MPGCCASRAAALRILTVGRVAAGRTGRADVRFDVARACSFWIAINRFRPPSHIFVRLFAMHTSQKGIGVCLDEGSCALHNNINPAAMLSAKQVPDPFG